MSKLNIDSYGNGYNSRSGDGFGDGSGDGVGDGYGTGHECVSDIFCDGDGIGCGYQPDAYLGDGYGHGSDTYGFGGGGSLASNWGSSEF